MKYVHRADGNTHLFDRYSNGSPVSEHPFRSIYFKFSEAREYTAFRFARRRVERRDAAATIANKSSVYSLVGKTENRLLSLFE